MTITVKLDVAGFYFSVIREVPAGTTLRQLMQQIANESSLGPILTSEQVPARFSFVASPRRFVSRIGITFERAPQARQVKVDGEGNFQEFPPLKEGTYAALDETRVHTAQGVAELTWQYYANAATFTIDKDGNDVLDSVGAVLNREAGLAAKRKVVSFADYAMDVDQLITWRLIAIMVAGDPLPAATT